MHLTCLGDNNAQIFTEDNCHSILIITKTLDHIIMNVHHYRYLMYYSFIFHVLFVLLSRLPGPTFESGNQVNGHFPCHCGVEH